MNIFDYYDKHKNKIKLFILICFVLSLIFFSCVAFILDYKNIVVDKELNKRVSFCHNLTGYHEYIIDCDLTGECSKLYVDCDYINTWEIGVEYSYEGVFDIDKLKEKFQNYNKYHMVMIR